MAAPSDEWVTQEEIANEIGIPVNRIRPIVTALASLGQIKTSRSIKDRRYLLVHKSSVAIIKQAVQNQPE